MSTVARIIAGRERGEFMNVDVPIVKRSALESEQFGSLMQKGALNGRPSRLDKLRVRHMEAELPLSTGPGSRFTSFCVDPLRADDLKPRIFLTASSVTGDFELEAWIGTQAYHGSNGV